MEIVNRMVTPTRLQVKGWARVGPAGAHTLRRGAWYPVDRISQGNSTNPLTHAVKPAHPIVEKLQMLFQLLRLDGLSERPSRKRPARMRDLENLQSHPFVPIRRQDGDAVREVVIAESPVA